MEHKAWLWKRKSSEKTITANEKSDLSSIGNEQEKEKGLELEKSLQDLKEQLSFAREASNAKDDLLAKQIKVAEQATAGWEKAETEAESFKKELAGALLQKAVAEERIVSIDATLKECMQQLHVLKEEHQHTVNDASTKISRLQERAQLLEKRLGETNNSLGKLGVEYTNLNRILEVKERLIEDLTESKSQNEASFTALVARLDSSEKDNASLKYEVSMLQKELDIRNHDRDFHLKSADAAHKQYLESMKKIAKLESECQRLRVMVRKRLPGPAAIAKMRSEVEMLGNNTVDMTRKKPSLALDAMMSKDFMLGNDYDSSSKRIASLVQRLQAVEDENKILSETLVKKNNELQSSRIMFARTASKLSQAEKQLEEFSKGQTSLGLARSSFSNDLPLASISEGGGNEDAISCTESWASALISELEHFRNGKVTTSSTTTAGVSELSLMDDFIEMEKLAIVCVDKQSESLNVNSGERTTSLALKEPELEVISSGKEIVPVDTISNLSGRNHEVQNPSWLQDILRLIMQKHHITNKSLYVILDEVSVALGLQHCSVKGNPLDVLSVSSITSQEIKHTSSDSLDGTHVTSMLQNEANKKPFRSDLEKPLCKIIELIEGIIQRSFTNNIDRLTLAGQDESTGPCSKSFSPTGHVARAFLWEVSELRTVLQHFIVVCNDLLHGKADLKKFTYELALTLEWIINHCFSLQDVSTMEETMKKLFNGDMSHGVDEFKAGTSSLSTETNKIKEPEELKSRMGYLPSLSTLSNGQYQPQIEEIESKLKDENRRLRSEIRDIESRKKDLEKRLESASAQNEYLSAQLKQSDERISNLQAELMTLKCSNRLIEDQIENQKLISEDLGSQLTVANAELNQARQKFSSLEVELEDKSNCCEELEATCLELQLQLESVATNEIPKDEKGQEEKQLRTDWEISAASEKLAECQATILDLGKQLKALASPKNAPLFDKVISPPSASRISHRRTQLLDQMQAEDEATSEHIKSPNTKEIICTEIKQPPSSTNSENNPNAGLLYGRKLGAINSMNRVNQPSEVKSSDDAGKLVIVPKRQKGGVSFLKKLLSRRKKESSKKKAIPIGS